ncbi:hypothetical protein ACIGDM_10250 [Rothia koreensis]|uniref:hypothetical protein n=1 Tax=Rothia koreensis TaxID=592378 RepID=UPI0037CC1BED
MSDDLDADGQDVPADADDSREDQHDASGQLREDQGLRERTRRDATDPESSLQPAQEDSQEGAQGVDSELAAREASDESALETVIEERLRVMLAESYSGLLPQPDHFDRYDADTRERILRMSESYTTDESSRRDKLIDAEVKEARVGRRTATWMFFVAMVLTFVTVLLAPVLGFNPWVGTVFLALPVTSVIRDMTSGMSRGGGERNSKPDQSREAS